MRIDGIPGLTVTLHSNGADLPELQPSNDVSNPAVPVQSCYVEATTGACFAICIFFEPSFPHGGSDIGNVAVMDGKFLAGERVLLGGSGPWKCNLEGRRCVQEGRAMLQRFCFSGLETSESKSGVKPR